VDESGTVVERYSYSPYGERTVLDADWSADADGLSDVDNALGHQGLYLDGESALYYNRNRYYSPSLGRFTARDPLGYVDGMSVYEYVGSSPIPKIDPTGMIVIGLGGLLQGTGDVVAAMKGREGKDGEELTNGILKETAKSIAAGGLQADPDADGVTYVEVSGKAYSFHWKWDKDKLVQEYKDFLDRKKDNWCSLEQFVVFGHSDGAAAIYQALKGGDLSDSDYPPAYIAFLDLVRLSDVSLPNTDENTSEQVTIPKGTEWANYRQTTGKPAGWKGRLINGKGIDVGKDLDAYYVKPNGKRVEVDHFGVLSHAGIQEVIARDAADAYSWAAYKEMKAKGVPPWDLDEDESW
jgi:RHS repeat-associated protein